MKKLFQKEFSEQASLEDDNVIYPVYTMEDAVSLEALAADIRELEDALLAGETAIASLEAISNTFSLEGSTNATINMANVAIQAACDPIGLPHEQVFSLEDDSVEMSLEAISAKVKAVWEAMVKMLKKWAIDISNWFAGAAAKYNDRVRGYKALIKELDALPEDHDFSGEIDLGSDLDAISTPDGKSVARSDDIDVYTKRISDWGSLYTNMSVGYARDIAYRQSWFLELRGNDSIVKELRGLKKKYYAPDRVTSIFADEGYKIVRDDKKSIVMQFETNVGSNAPIMIIKKDSDGLLAGLERLKKIDGFKVSKGKVKKFNRDDIRANLEALIRLNKKMAKTANSLVKFESVAVQVVATGKKVSEHIAALEETGNVDARDIKLLNDMNNTNTKSLLYALDPLLPWLSIMNTFSLGQEAFLKKHW